MVVEHEAGLAVTIPAEPCPKCGGQATKQRRINDALIVATAELREFDRLYTKDKGMLHLGKFAKNVTVERPPPAPEETLPLFPRLDAPAEIGEPKKPRSKRGKK